MTIIERIERDMADTDVDCVEVRKLDLLAMVASIRAGNVIRGEARCGPDMGCGGGDERCPWCRWDRKTEVLFAEVG